MLPAVLFLSLSLRQPSLQLLWKKTLPRYALISVSTSEDVLVNNGQSFSGQSGELLGRPRGSEAAPIRSLPLLPRWRAEASAPGFVVLKESDHLTIGYESLSDSI